MSTISQKMVVKLSINGGSRVGDSNSEEEELNPDTDIELCVLKYGSNGVLEITPDFTHNRRPYTVEVRNSFPALWKFAITLDIFESLR